MFGRYWWTPKEIFISLGIHEQLDFIVNVERDLGCMMNSMGFTNDLVFLMNSM